MLIDFNLKKKHLIILIFTPLYILTKIIPELKLVNNNNKDLIYSFSRGCLFIFYIFEKQSINSNKDLNKKNFGVISKLTKKRKNKQRLVLFYLLLLSYIFHIIYIYTLQEKTNFYRGPPETSILFLIDGFFFKKAIYSHHILSLSLFVILFLLIITYIRFSSLRDFFSLIYLFLNGYCYGFSMYLIKYINFKFFTSIYLLGSSIGIIRLIFFIIFLNLNLHEIYGDDIFYEILYFLACLFYNYIYFYVILNSGIIHAVIYYYFSDLILIIFQNNDIFYILIIFFFTISGLIYIEILVLKFLGLNKNIETEVQKRAENETINLDVIVRNESVIGDDLIENIFKTFK